MWLMPILACVFLCMTLGRCDTCITTGTSNPQKSTPFTPCKFPFVFKNETFNGCTTDKKERLWCSTKVEHGTNAHVKGNWGFCPSTCDKSCSKDETCKHKSECSQINSELKRYKAMTKNDSERPLLLSKLKSLVCNSKSRKFCCHISTREYIDVVNTPESINENEPKKSFHPLSCETNSTKNFLGDILPSTGTCGLSCNSGARVIKGQDAKLGEFPWAALLGYQFVKRTFDFRTNKYRVWEKYIKYQCGGTLINTWYVLTAAHCHKQGEKDNEIAQVILGEWEVSDWAPQNKDPDCSGGKNCLPKVQKILVDRVVRHKDYARSGISVVNDIALIRLKTEAILNAGVQLACLPLNISRMATKLQIRDFGNGLEGYSGTVIGWGHVKNFDTGDFETAHVAKAILQKAKPPLLSFEECQKARGDVLLSPNHLCAGGGPNGANFCKGDSGGGIFIRKNSSDLLDAQVTGYVQVGIVSFGSVVCGDNSPGVYTRVSKYISWIYQNMEP